MVWLAGRVPTRAPNYQNAITVAIAKATLPQVQENSAEIRFRTLTRSGAVLV